MLRKSSWSAIGDVCAASTDGKNAIRRRRISCWSYSPRNSRPVVPAVEATFWATGLNGSNRLVAPATVLEDRILTVRRQETIENAPSDESVSCLRFEIVERRIRHRLRQLDHERAGWKLA